MKVPKKSLKSVRLNAVLLLLALVAVLFELWFRLGSITHSLVASQEVIAARTAVGWHGIYHFPLDFPLKLVRSVVFKIKPNHAAMLTRLPNTLFGLASIVSFAWLVKLWHGNRVAILSTCLFATSAWTLHVSRLASYDVLYLWGILTLLLTHVQLYRQKNNPYIWYLNLIVWLLLLTIPGFIWFVLLDVYLQRAQIKEAWKEYKSGPQRALTLLLSIVWLPLAYKMVKNSVSRKSWLGLPTHWASAWQLVKNFFAVLVHLFFRGPQYPALWLGKSPVLDAFTLLMALIGIYFYARHFKNSRSHLLASFFILSVILIAINGPVSFSLIVPLGYLFAATGIAYLLHSWLKVFPLNPLGRSVGIGLISLAVAVSCIYNLRSYFVAWPYAPPTNHTFIYHLK